MTTTVHIVNLGPKPIVLKSGTHFEETLYPSQSTNKHVWDEEYIEITEKSTKEGN